MWYFSLQIQREAFINTKIWIVVYKIIIWRIKNIKVLKSSIVLLFLKLLFWKGNNTMEQRKDYAEIRENIAKRISTAFFAIVINLYYTWERAKLTLMVKYCSRTCSIDNSREKILQRMRFNMYFPANKKIVWCWHLNHL